MQDEDIVSQAQRAGIETRWQDVSGNIREVPVGVLRQVLAAMGDGDDGARRATLITADVDSPIVVSGSAGAYRITLEEGRVIDGQAAVIGRGEVQLPPVNVHGYHRLELDGRELTLAVAPQRCWTVSDATAGAKAWGLAVQLYALRRVGDGGLGDFAALGTLARHAADAGADAIAISPVHAQFAADPWNFSPYSPSSRVMLNGLYADPESDAAQPEEAPDGLLNWPAASLWRQQAFRARFRTMMVEQAAEFHAFDSFRAESGLALAQHAVFEALHSERFTADPGNWDWRRWTADLRDPTSGSVARFAQTHQDDISYHAYLQFRATTGLAHAQQEARAAGMRIGVIADIAVGVSAGGSDAWGRQAEMLNGLTIGAPPDLFNTNGQDWGVTSFSPRNLPAHGYQTFLDMLRAALRHAGGVRLDHVMGLARLWVVPQGNTPGDGAYLRYPHKEILRLVRLESWRNRAIVLGEDLGTLPDGFRETLETDGLAGMRVLWFERNGRHFIAPSAWSPSAAAMTSTHDLPTVAGWWVGRDLEWRKKLGIDAGAAEGRDEDRGYLWSAMQESGSAQGAMPATWDAHPVVAAACAHIGTSACALALLPIEDALALPEQPNLPGTLDQHPNWRRRLAYPVDSVLTQPDIAARLQALARSRRQT